MLLKTKLFFKKVMKWIYGYFTSIAVKYSDNEIPPQCFKKRNPPLRLVFGEISK